MTNVKRERIALFRYGIIFPLLNDKLERGEQERIILQICSQEHEIPYTERKTISRGAVLDWLYRYKRNRNIDDLKPKGRSDAGKCKALPPDVVDELVKLRKQKPDVPLTTIVSIAQKEGILQMGKEAPMSSIYRAFVDFRKDSDDAADRRRFEMESCNDMWMCDAMSGPHVWRIDEDGHRKSVKSSCFGFIDDKSRLITHAEFYDNEKCDSLMDCMWKGMNKYGLPRRIYTDNGSAMRDTRLALGLADLEVHLSFAKPYSPQGKAKCERFWRTLRMEFLPMLPEREVYTLAELNSELRKWVETYNNRYHCGIGMSPNERFSEDMKAIRVAPTDLPVHFRRRETRTVSKARTITIDNRFFQVPLGLSGRKVEARFMSLDSRIDIYLDGEHKGVAEELNLVANANSKRMGI